MLLNLVSVSLTFTGSQPHYQDLANANPVPLPTARSVLVCLRGHKANGIDLDVETHRVKDEDLANANPVPLPTTRSILVCLV